MKKRSPVYRPLTTSAVAGNSVLIVLVVGVALVLGVQQVPLRVVLLNLLVAVVVAGFLAFLGSGWAMAGIVASFFLGPVLARFAPSGVQLSVRVWFLGIIAGWVLGALVRRFSDRGRTSSDSADGPVLQWWVRGKRFEERGPTVGQVEAKIHALDGRDRTLVIVRDRSRRLEVCGDSSDGVVIFRTSDASDDSLWEVPLGGDIDNSDSVETSMGDTSAPIARGLLLDETSAADVARGFLAGRDTAGPAGTWRGEAVLTVRPPLP